MTSDVPLPKVPGDGAPEGSNVNDVFIFKGYFCKFMCEHDWDNFNELQVFTNYEFQTHARAIYNNETEKAFMDNIFDSDAEYQKMTRFIIASLVNQGLLRKELESDGTTYSYWKTSVLNELCPQILAVGLPSIDFLVDRYYKEHPRKWLLLLGKNGTTKVGATQEDLREGLQELVDAMTEEGKFSNIPEDVITGPGVDEGYNNGLEIVGMGLMKPEVIDELVKRSEVVYRKVMALPLEMWLKIGSESKRFEVEEDEDEDKSKSSSDEVIS